jgi:hypothetical protein
MQANAVANNIISFPLKNPRLDHSFPITPDEIATELGKMKREFFHTVADDLLDTMFRTIEKVNFGDGEHNGELVEEDLIFFREALASILCRMGGVWHPWLTLPSMVVKNVTQRDDGALDFTILDTDILELVPKDRGNDYNFTMFTMENPLEELPEDEGCE